MAHRTRPDETRCAKTADSARHVAFNPPTSRTEVSDHGASSCPPWGVLSPPGGQSLFGAHRHPVAAGQSRRRPCRYCVEHELQLALTGGSNNADAPSGSSTNPTTDSPSRCRPHRQPGAPNRPTWRTENSHGAPNRPTWRTENSHGAPNRPTWRTENSHGAPNATWRAIHRPPCRVQRAKTKLGAPRPPTQPATSASTRQDDDSAATTGPYPCPTSPRPPTPTGESGDDEIDADRPAERPERPVRRVRDVAAPQGTIARRTVRSPPPAHGSRRRCTSGHHRTESSRTRAPGASDATPAPPGGRG